MRALFLAVLFCAPIFAQEEEEEVEEYQRPSAPREPKFGLHFVLEALGSVVISPAVEGFHASSATDTQEVEGIASVMPNGRLGLGIETNAAFIDIMGGGGALVNEALIAPMGEGIVAVRFKLGKLFTVGPEAGVVYFGEPDFEKDGVEPKFSDSLGWLAGLNFTFGIRAISLSVSFDYLSAEFDLKRSSGFSTNWRELDFSGPLIQFGIVSRFP